MKNIFVKLIFAILLVFCSFSFAWAENEVLDHAIGIYVSPRGQDYFRDNLRKILDKNNFEYKSKKVKADKIDLGSKTIGQLMPGNRKITDTISKLKKEFKEYFSGFRFRNSHRIIIDHSDIVANIGWDKMGVELSPYGAEEIDNGVLFNLRLELDSFKVAIKKIKIKDNNHKFLEEIILEDIEAGLESGPLTMNFSVHIFVDNREKNIKNRLKFKVKSPDTNIADLDLYFDRIKITKFPQIQLFSNGEEVFRNKVSPIRKVLNNQRRKILNGLKQYAQKWLSNTYPAYLQEIMASTLVDGSKKSIDVSPVGSDEPNQKPFQVKLFPHSMDFFKNFFHVGLSAKFFDPQYKKSVGPLPRSQWATGFPKLLSYLEMDDFDVAFTLNESVINRLIQLGARRGYFDNLKTSTGDIYPLATRPVLTLKKKKGYATNLPAIKLVVDYPVGKYQKILVKPPLLVEFEVWVKFPIVDNKVQMVFDNINFASIKYNKESLKFSAFGSSELILKKMIWKKLKEIDTENRGMIIADEIPVPIDKLGLPVDITKVNVDENGNLNIFTKFKF